MLIYLFWALAAVTTLAVFLLSSLSLWWLLPVLLGAFVFWNLLYVLYVFIICRRVDMTQNYNTLDPFYHKNVLLFIDWLLTFLRVKTELLGREWLPEGEFLLVSNHRSAFDPLTTMVALRDLPLAFIAKPSLIYKLFVGAAAYRACFLAIDRENARNALKTINEAAQRMRDHVCSYGIYPEGTRSKDGNLMEFHHGSFKAAQKAHVPVVIMATEGTELVKKNFPFRRTHVTLTILECIDGETVRSMKTSELADHTKALLLEHIGH